MASVPEIVEVTHDRLAECCELVDRTLFGRVRRSPKARPDQVDELLNARPIAAFDGGRMVGTAAAIRCALGVPGGMTVRAAGICRVAVSPTHRRRGLLRAMMARQFALAREAGELAAVLRTSEASLYGRFGFGLASYECGVEIERHRGQFAYARSDPGRVRLERREGLDTDLSEVWVAALPGQPGMAFPLDGGWEGLVYRGFPADGEDHLYAIYEHCRRLEGFAVYRVHAGWRRDRQPDGTVEIVYLLALSDDAYAALWRHCLDIDLCIRVSAGQRPVDEPLRFLLADPRALSTCLVDGLWLRLIDVRGALASRRYQPGQLVLEVTDPSCPWNAGRYRLRDGECELTGAEPDLALDVSDLGACFLGGNRFVTLARAGRIDVRTPAAAARADYMFHSDRLPWCPLKF